MKTTTFIKICSSVLVLMICFLVNFFWTPSLARAQEKKPSKASNINQPKYALLVGVGKYRNKEIKPIEGCRNNVSLLAETLIQDYGFQPENVDAALVDEKATKDEIKRRFRSNLIDNAEKAKKAGKEAVIVYYFCGHGSQTDDQDRDETDDEKDETFLAYDSRTGIVSDILDDEIDDLKWELRQFTTNTTLIFESCNSGTGSRRSEFDEKLLTVEETDADKTTRKPFQRSHPATSDDDVLTYTEIAAAASDRNALSDTAENCKCDKPYSFMTKALVEALKRATPSTTYRGLIREVSSAVTEMGSPQSPQIEGNRDAILFGGAARLTKPYIEIEQILPDNQILIEAGTVHGLKIGSQVSFYSSESETNTGEKYWLTNGVVVKVGHDNSLVKVPKSDGINNFSHVVLVSPVFGGGSFLVALDPKDQPDLSADEMSLHQKIETFLVEEKLTKETQTVKLIPSDKISPAEKKEAKGLIRLRKGKVKDVFYQPGTGQRYPMVPIRDKNTCQDKFPADDSEVYYLDDGVSGGAPLFGKTFDPTDPKLAEKIVETIKNYAFQTNLKTLENTASSVTSMIRVRLQKIPDGAIKFIECENGQPIQRIDPDLFKEENFQTIKDGKIPLNSYYKINVENISGEVRREELKKQGKDPEGVGGYGFYITVLGLTARGEIKILYQSIGDKDYIKDGEAIPKQILIKASQPVGVERYTIVIQKVASNNKKFNFSFYETPKDLVNRDALSDLMQIITQSGYVTREEKTMLRDEPGQWGVIHLDLNVVKKN